MSSFDNAISLNIKFGNKVLKIKILFDDILMNWFRKESSRKKKLYYTE